MTELYSADLPLNSRNPLFASYLRNPWTAYQKTSLNRSKVPTLLQHSNVGTPFARIAPPALHLLSSDDSMKQHTCAAYTAKCLHANGVELDSKTKAA